MRDSGNYDYPVEIISEEEYWGKFDKTSSGRPTSLYVNYSSPNLTFYVYPTPDTVENLYFISDKPFIEPANLSQEAFDTLQLPRSYHKPITDNLAMELAPEYGAQVDPMLIQAAVKGKASLVSSSAARRVGQAKTEFSGMGGRYSFADFKAGV